MPLFTEYTDSVFPADTPGGRESRPSIDTDPCSFSKLFGALEHRDCSARVVPRLSLVTGKDLGRVAMRYEVGSAPRLGLQGGHAS